MFYEKHVFVCVNQKADGKKCCANANNAETAAYLKQKLQVEGCWGPDKIRLSTSGCLGRCANGPCMVVYPEGVWYRIENQTQADEVIEKHLKNNEVVENLVISD